ncbi:sensor histidine kinase [Pontitalea aquivivens]|uniref:sensor histidine kinase n=1 Tax=Pontitalea aquivivens TaxID=3388663 RepID=UPI0039706017
MITRRLRQIGLPVAIVVACLGALAFGLMRLAEIERTMRIKQSANMLWVISQAEAETLRLDAALARNPADAPVIGTRFDLLASRLTLIAEGPQLRALDRIGLSGPLMDQRARVLALDPRAAPMTPERALRLAGALEQLRQVLRRAGNRTMVADWGELSRRLELYRGAVAQVIVSLVLGIGFAAYLGWRLVADQRALLRAEELRLRAIRLERDLDQERTQAAYWRDFAAVVSHQFRTPLAVIDSAAQRMLRGQPTPGDTGHRARLATIRRTVADLSRLVEAALIAGQIDNDLKQPRCARHDVVAPLRALIADLQARHPGRSLRLDAAAEPMLAWCDPGLMQHTVMNLLENALRHCAGPVVVRLFQRDDRIACAIVDTGPGIAPADLGRIFDRFRRGPASGVEGSGLGLWTARRLAELQGGTVEVESWPGRGSVFTLWLAAMAPAQVAA